LVGSYGLGDDMVQRYIPDLFKVRGRERDSLLTEEKDQS
jgi:hypothetical protein